MEVSNTPSRSHSGNPLRVQLLRYPDVLFAGYRLPHPLETKLTLKIQVPLPHSSLFAFLHSLPWLLPLAHGALGVVSHPASRASCP